MSFYAHLLLSAKRIKELDSEDGEGKESCAIDDMALTSEKGKSEIGKGKSGKETEHELERKNDEEMMGEKRQKTLAPDSNCCP